jgi:hypothetical protein
METEALKLDGAIMVKVLVGVVSVGQSRGKYVFVRNTSFQKSHLYTFDAIAAPHHMTLQLGHALSFACWARLVSPLLQSNGTL